MEKLLKDIIIRLENKNDWSHVERVVREAFWRDERIIEIGVGATEHYMVHKMRENLSVKELSLIAEFKGQINGHITLSRGSYVEQEDGTNMDVLNMVPVSVKPEYQNMGVGSLLIQKVLKKSKRLGFGAIFFYGHPEYYPRFGF